MRRRIVHALERLWEGRAPRGAAGRAAVWLLAIPAWMYGTVQRFRRRLYRWGWLRSRTLFPVVVSIGALRVGGAGKTPFTGWVARGLRQRGYRVAVLTRGYGRSAPRRSLVLHQGNRASWDPVRWGDEPCLLAGSLEDVPVAVDARRHRGAVDLMRFFAVDVFLLDDGFQHLRLGRDVDIVLLSEGEDPRRMFCLPRGPLREPASALGDAHIVVRVGSGTGTDRGEADADPMGRGVAGGLYQACILPGELRVLGGGERVDPRSLEGKRLLAFCGIARPARFMASLEQLGIRPCGCAVYPDHHRYSARDHEALTERLRGFDRAVTTAKDAVKLARFAWPPGKLLVLEIRPVVRRESEFWQDLAGRIDLAAERRAGGGGRPPCRPPEPGGSRVG